MITLIEAETEYERVKADLVGVVTELPQAIAAMEADEIDAVVTGR